MEIVVDGRTYVELPGQGITGFRLYSTENFSCIAWEYEKEFYTYFLKNENHVTQAAELFGLLKKNGLDTFVAVREGKSKRLHKYHKVMAVKLR